MDKDLLSSPDPLGDDSVFQSPPKRSAPRARRSLPSQGSSPKKQTFELDVGNEISPQKIRVTVEAGRDAENAYTSRVDRSLISPSPFRQPVNRRGERTTTTTIPVKGLSDTEDEVEADPGVATPKRGRGRPRKSNGTPVGTKKRGRPNTPVKKSPGKRKSIGDLVDGDDSADGDFQIGKGVDIERGKGRSRSRSKKGISRNATPTPEKAASSDKLASSVASKRGRRKSLMPEDVVVLQDEEEGLSSSADDNGALAVGDDINFNESEATLARSEQHDEAPWRKERSSPRMVDPFRIPSSNRQSNKFSSPSVSPEKSGISQYGEPSVAMVSVSSPEKVQEDSPDSNEEPDHDGDYYDDEEDYGDEEPREFDTILESEGFSMISVDSVPSLREHINSPAVQEDTPREAPRNRSLLSVEEVEDSAPDDSFSSIPAEILDAATPGRVAQNRKLLSVQRAHDDDSFSSIPPEVLELATPRLKSHVSRLLSTKNSRIEDSFSSIPPDILEAATPARPLHSQSSSEKTQNAENNEDSFSVIPSAVLETATPAPIRQASFQQSSIPQSGTSNVNHSAATSAPVPILNLAPPRLPTPEDTPSPATEMSNQSVSASGGKVSTSQSVSEGPTSQHAGDEPSLLHSQMRSSPPSLAPHRYKHANHLLQQQKLYPDLTATPSIQFSSPSLPPPIHAMKGPDSQSLGPLDSQRPELSPIARTGRALQDLIVPSSPRNRAQSLGSPFKSPLAERMPSSLSRDSQNGTHFCQGSRSKPLPKLNLEDNLFPNLGNGFQARPQSSSSRHGFRGQSQEPSPQNSRWNNSRHNDDPFSNNVSTQLCSPSPEEREAYNLEVPDRRRRSDPNILNTCSENAFVLSDDAMSWQADVDPPTRNTPGYISGPSDGTHQSSANRQYTGESNQSREERWAEKRPAESRQVDLGSTSQVIVIDSDDDNQISAIVRQNGESISHAAEDDIECYSLLLETINSSSPSIEQRRVEQRMFDNFDKPRRSKIPSPWRKSSKRHVYGEELVQLSSPHVAQNSSIRKEVRGAASTQPITVRRIMPQSPNEISALSISQKSNFSPCVRSSGSLDLSALLGSPSKELPVLPSSSQDTSLSQQKQPVVSPSSRHSDSAASSSVRQNGAFDEQNLRTQSLEPLPQKVGFRPRVRSIGAQDLSALLNSPMKGLPILQSSSEDSSLPIQRSSNLYPSSDLPESGTGGSSGIPDSSPCPQQPFTLPQKMAFKPRVRESGDIAMSEQLTSSPVKQSPSFAPKTLGGISKTNLFSRQANSTSTPLAVASSSRMNSLQVNWSSTPPSPSAYTEDDSYDVEESYTVDGKDNQSCRDRVLDADENARRAVPQHANFSPTKSILRSPIKQIFGEETAGKTVGWVPSSPTPSEETAPLSPTTWSREHWDLLERIRQAWMPDSWLRDPSCPKLPATTPKRRRSFNEMSVVSKLLGRVVTSQGERMRLEQWHLEAVDEFREEVPGWEELAVAIRLFGLIIGRERRGNGTVGLRREMRARGEDPDAGWKAKKAAEEAAKASAK